MWFVKIVAEPPASEYVLVIAEGLGIERGSLTPKLKH